MGIFECEKDQVLGVDFSGYTTGGVAAVAIKSEQPTSLTITIFSAAEMDDINKPVDNLVELVRRDRAFFLTQADNFGMILINAPITIPHEILDIYRPDFTFPTDDSESRAAVPRRWAYMRSIDRLMEGMAPLASSAGPLTARINMALNGSDAKLRQLRSVVYETYPTATRLLLRGETKWPVNRQAIKLALEKFKDDLDRRLGERKTENSALPRFRKDLKTMSHGRLKLNATQLDGLLRYNEYDAIWCAVAGLKKNVKRGSELGSFLERRWVSTDTTDLKDAVEKDKEKPCSIFPSNYRVLAEWPEHITKLKIVRNE